MNQFPRWLITGSLGALLAAGCSSPTDQSSGNVLADRPAPGGDGTVARMPLDGAPLGIAVARAGFAYITQPDHGSSSGRVARVDLNARTVSATVAVGMVPSLVIFNQTQTRAYVSNQWSDNVGIIDVASNTQTDVIPTSGDPFALALSPDGKTLLVTTNVNRLFKFDIATKAELGSIALPATSHHIIMDPKGKFLYVATRDGGTVMEVDWRAMTVNRTFTLSGRPQDMAFSPDGTQLYIANEFSNVVHVIKLPTGTFTNIPLAGGGEGLALGNSGNDIYVGLVFNGYVQVIDRRSAETIRLIAVGGIPREIALDYNGKDVLVSNEAGWIDFIRPADSAVPPPPPPPPPPPLRRHHHADTGFSRVALSGGPLGGLSRATLRTSARTAQSVARLQLGADVITAYVAVGNIPCYIVFNSAGTRAYVTHQFSDSISVIDVATNTQIATIPLTGDPLPVAISTDDQTLFVTTNANQLFKVDLATNTVTGSLSLPATSHHLLTHPNGNLLYVATRDGGSVLEVDWHTMTVVRTFTLGGRPQGMAISANQTELYVANELSNVLHIITLSNGAMTNVPLTSGGEGMALGADRKLYIGEVFAGFVEVVDPITRTVVRTITVGGTPREVASDPARNRVLVANEAGWVDFVHIH
jgi:YVTN family beta-propeller protein